MIPVSFGYTEGRSSAINAGRNINVYASINSQDARFPLSLSERPALKQWVRPSGTNGQVRAFHKRGDFLYSLIAGQLWKTNVISKDSVLLGSIGNNSGAAWIESNANSQVLVVANNTGYIYNWSTGAFGAISDADFPGAISLTFQGNYALIVEPNSGRIWNSDLNDFSAWTALAFVTAESYPDDLKAIISDHRETLALGETTGEFYVESGDVSAVFQRQSGGILEIGINAPLSLVKIAGVVLWLDDKLQVRLMDAHVPVVVSTNAIGYQIRSLSRTNDAIGMAFIWDDRMFYVLSFPTANKTFAYDITTSGKAQESLWHGLSSYPLDNDNRWRGNCSAQDGATVYVGDYENGWIYTLDDTIHTDNLQPVSRVWTAVAVYDRERHRNMFHNILEVEVEYGVETDAEPNPQIMMQYSDDNGKTWSHELWETIGQIGEDKKGATWAGLGMSRSRIYKFKITDNVKVEVVAIYLHAKMGNH